MERYGRRAFPRLLDRFGRSRTIRAALFTAAAVAYAGILWQARLERRSVMDWVPYAAALGSDAAAMKNVARYPNYGFVDAGNGDGAASFDVMWKLRAANVSQPSDYLYIVADEPRMFGPRAAARVFFAGRLVGELGTSAPDKPVGPYTVKGEREQLFVPPARAYGYRFSLPWRARDCRAGCAVAIDGTLVTWRIYRVGIVRETPRFPV